MLRSRRRQTPSLEVSRLDWRVEEFLEKPLDWIRRRVDDNTHLVLHERDEIPVGWPAELKRPFDDGTHWCYQDRDGIWTAFSDTTHDNSYVRRIITENPDDETRRQLLREMDGSPAWIYTRDPLAAEHVHIRPIVYLAIDVDGICADARDEWTDGILMEMLRRRGLWKLEDDVPSWMTPENGEMHIGIEMYRDAEERRGTDAT